MDGSPGIPCGPWGPGINANEWANAAAAAAPATAALPPAAAALPLAAAALPPAAAALAVASAADADAAAACAPAVAADALASPALATACVFAVSACILAVSACVFAVSAPVLAVWACVLAVSASVFAVCACVLKFSVSDFICCNSDLYVDDIWIPNTDDDKLESAILTSTPLIDVDKLLPVFNSNSSFILSLKLLISYLKSNNLVTESNDKTLPVFNPLQLKVVHSSLLAFTCNVSLYLALNFLVEKSINNGPASSTPLASNFGLMFFLY